MAYSNDQTQIRAGLVNYIGALLKSSPFLERAACQNIVSILSEEALRISSDKDGVVDLYIAKPVIRSLIFILNQRCAEMGKLPKSPSVE
jgi:hypothetical protein